MFPLGVLSQPSGMSSLLTSLRAWYKMEESSGDRVDAHSNGPDIGAFQTDDPGSNTGIKSNAIEFNGAERKFISRDATNAGQLAFSSAFSISMWIYMDIWDATDRHILYRSSGSSNGYRVKQINSASFGLSFILRSARVDVYDASITTGTWYHLYCWWSGTTMGIRVNDTWEDSQADTTGPNGTYHHFYWAGDNFGDSFDGRMDEVAFWARTLTADEVTWLYNSGAGRTYEDI